MKKALLSVCLGANSTAVAWTKHPEEFAEIQANVMLQPLEGRSIGEQFSKALGFEGGYDRLDQAVLERTGFHLAEQSPAKYASAITMPTLVAQEHDDVMTIPEAVQAVHDAIPVEVASISPGALLFVVGEHAQSRYFSEDACELAAEPKELYVVPGANHVDLYDRTDLIPFDKLEEFFTKNLA
ncbi:alpha/beta hydrolase [Streptomyces sp. R41]|uniref:Alpha/beta hydrolase n=1 Tax=Streptomyces sp. R41 TaxID=3238632 RepID=A0AB39RQB7_9ACTN